MRLLRFGHRLKSQVKNNYSIHTTIMFNTKVLRELFNQVSDNDKIYEILMASDPPTQQTQAPLMRLLKSLPVKEFSDVCGQLRSFNLDTCDLYAQKLIGKNPVKFSAGDADTVYNGIMAITRDLFEKEGPHLTEDHRVVFKLLIQVVITGAYVALTDLFYTPEFLGRLEILKKWTISSPKGPTSYYCYVKRMLQSNSERYAQSVKPKAEVVNGLDSFISRVLENGNWHHIFLYSVTDAEFKSSLLRYVVKSSLTEDNDHHLARMYAILLIFYTTEEIRTAYKLHGRYEPQGEIMRSCVTNVPMNPYNATMLTNVWSIIKLIKMWIGKNKKHLLLTAIDEIDDLSRDSGFDSHVLSSIWNFCNSHIGC